MKHIILSSIFVVLSSTIFAGDFDCSKMDNKMGLGFGAMYGTFYALGYNDAKNKKEISKRETRKIGEKVMEYIIAGCDNDPNSDIVTLIRKGIKSEYSTSDFPKIELRGIDKFFIEIDKNFKKRSYRKCMLKPLSDKDIKAFGGWYNDLEKLKKSAGSKEYTDEMFSQVIGKETLGGINKFFKSQKKNVSI